MKIERSKLRCEAIPYNGFKERIKISKELQKPKRKFIVERDFIVAY